MRADVLLDVTPATGGHGLRGIGRYVRGVVGSLEEWPPERRERVWAVGRAGEILDRFGARGIPSRSLGLRPLDLGLILGPMAAGGAVRKSGARIFHATDPHRPWTLSRVRQLVTVYDLIPLREAAMLASWKPHQRFVYHAYLRQIRTAEAIVAISGTTARDVAERLGVSEDRIAVVSPVVEAPSHFGRVPQEDGPTFLLVGALDSHKRPELAIEALARFRARQHEGRLRLIGPSDERQRAGVLGHARRLGVLDWVTLEGRISDAELDAAYASATALLSTSSVEGFGLPAVEAALRGVPVISVDIPSARETVAAAATLVQPDAEAIAEAMAKPRAPSREARDRLRVRYCRRSAAEALWAAYEPLLSRSRV